MLQKSTMFLLIVFIGIVEQIYHIKIISLNSIIQVKRENSLQKKGVELIDWVIKAMRAQVFHCMNIAQFIHSSVDGRLNHFLFLWGKEVKLL